MKSGNEYALLIPVTEHWVFTRLQIILLTIVIDVKNIFNLMIHLVIVVPYHPIMDSIEISITQYNLIFQNKNND